MSRINMIHHINIQITDRERTREWYERVLGAEFLDLDSLQLAEQGRTSASARGINGHKTQAQNSKESS